MIGIYKGTGKATDIEAFFASFLDEVHEARRLRGIQVRNRRIPFTFEDFFGDAPARALILNHYGHNSTCPCSKCKVHGFRFNNTMVYLGVGHRKRTNEEYETEIDEDHKKGRSPLVDLGIRMVTRVPFDIMHLVYIGLMCRLFDAWIRGKFGFRAKLGSTLRNKMSSRYVLLNNWCPDDYARRPTDLLKYYNFKATQMRHFLLYAASVILLGILNQDFYYHILLLHVAMRILTSSKQSEKLQKKAQKLLDAYVIFAEGLYTKTFVSIMFMLCSILLTMPRN